MRQSQRRPGYCRALLGHKPIGGVAEEVADGLQYGFGSDTCPRPVNEDWPVAVGLFRVGRLCNWRDGALTCVGQVDCPASSLLRRPMRFFLWEGRMLRRSWSAKASGPLAVCGRYFLSATSESWTEMGSHGKCPRGMKAWMKLAMRWNSSSDSRAVVFQRDDQSSRSSWWISSMWVTDAFCSRVSPGQRSWSLSTCATSAVSNCTWAGSA